MVEVLQADQCVLATVKGLLKRTRNKKIEVMEKACHPWTLYRGDWKKEYEKHERLIFSK